MRKTEFSNYSPLDGNAWNSGIAYKEADWFISYDNPSNETALVICGSDGIGVFFIVLRGDHTDEFQEVVKKSYGLNKYINGCLGECIRFAAQHKDLIPGRSTVGGWSTRLSIKVKEC